MKACDKEIGNTKSTHGKCSTDNGLADKMALQILWEVVAIQKT